MQIHIFASSSEGNCLLVKNGSTNILVDAGISAKRINTSLASAGLTPEIIDGVLITHEHSDHISGLNNFCKKYQTPVYALPAVCGALSYKCRDLDNIIPFPSDEFDIGNLLIQPFKTPHDSVDSCGFRISGEKSFAIATDMGYLTRNTVNMLENCDAALIESNYDEEMLSQGPYPYSLKMRIASNHGHLPVHETARLALHLVQSCTSRLILGHLSPVNITPEIAFSCVESAISDYPHELYIAPKAGHFILDL